MSLPRFMVLRSDASGKYLCYAKGKGLTRSSLAFSHEMKHPKVDDAECLESLKKMKDESVASEKTTTEFHLLKFEVEEAKTAPGFVHIRTCYNNKYFVRKSEESNSIAAEAHEAEEDESKWSCTLFKPIFLGDADDEEGGCLFANKHGIGMTPQKIQLMHVSQYHVGVGHLDDGELVLGIRADSAALTTFTVSDVDPTASLPEKLTFRGHDGKYLGTPDAGSLWFDYTDVGTKGVAMRNYYGTSILRRVILCADQWDYTYWTVKEDTSVYLYGGGYTWFNPVKVNNYVALYSLDNNKFVSRTSNNGVVAASSTITEESQLEVGEPVLSRKILSITYDLKNARVYGTSDVTKIADARSNKTDTKETGSLTREFTMSRTMTWNQSLTVSIGIEVSMSFGIPEVAGGAVDINMSISETCEWGEEKTQSETISHTYNFDIPPMTKQTKTVIASKSFCDVPFTCVVEDVMTDGTTRRYTKPDGMFTGANEYNAVEETQNEPIAD